MEKIVVIGSNHAGIATINTILDNHKDCELTVFERNSNISFLGCGMALWIADRVKSKESMFYTCKEDLEKKGAKFYGSTEVSNIDFDKKVVYAESTTGEKYEASYDKLVLATGSTPIIPKLEGSDLENIQRVKLFQDAEDVIKKLDNDDIKDVTVIGAGYIGIELIEAFKLKGKNVTLIDIADTCLPTYYDKKFTDMMKENLKENGINLKFNQQVSKFEGSGKVEYVVTDKEKIATDMVVWAVGFRPNTELAKDQLATFKNGAYLVNERQETSIKDVYAVGDCATLKFNAIKDTSYIALATNAVTEANFSYPPSKYPHVSFLISPCVIKDPTSA
ncbi:MAG: NADH oxidase, partial [Epulopiscium sp. Nuni2H_MBin001]